MQTDDGRHFLLTTKETFDGITADPFDPWVKGIAALYTKEFFELARRHLNPGGVITRVRSPLRFQRGGGEERNRHVLRGLSEWETFREHRRPQGYDMVLLGQAEPGPMDAERVEAHAISRVCPRGPVP